MPLLESPKPSFASGEVSPLIYGRHDFVRFDTGLARCQHWVILPQGGATRRPPTEFIAEAFAESILVPFEFDRQDSYIIEIGDQTSRFYRDGGQLESAPMTPLEVTLPYLPADHPDIRFTKSGDVVYLFHPTRANVQKLQRVGDTDWQLAAADFQNGPFLPKNADPALTLQASATTGTVTLTATGFVFDAGHVDSFWRIKTGFVKVTAVAGGGGSSSATATVTKPLVDTLATDDWAEGLFSTFRGFPTTGIFHQQRFMLAKGTFLAGSATSDFENMEVDGDPDGALLERVGAGTQRNNDIEWLSSGKVVTIGTSGEEFSLQGATLNSGITATSLRIVPGPTEGSIGADPVRVNSDVLHISKNGRRLQRLFFDFQVDDFRSDDLSIASEHITAPGMKRIQWQRDPLRVLWVLLTNGELRGFTYNRAQEMIAWHRHPIGGFVHDIAVIPSSDGTFDELWLKVERTIDSQQKFYIERMLRYFDHETDTDPAVIAYLDSQVSGTLNAGNDRILNLDHLEGETINAVIDGSLVQGLLVVNGQAVIPPESVPTSTVSVRAGLPIRSHVKKLPRQADLNDGVIEGRSRRIAGMAIRFHGAPGGLVGDLDDPDNMELLHEWDVSEMDTPPKLFKGIKSISLDTGWEDEDFVDLVVDGPFAMNILSAPSIYEVEEL